MIYDNFLRLCELAGEDPAEAIDKMGLRRNTLKHWKTRRLQGIDTRIRSDTVQKLIRHFGCSEDDVLRSDYIHKKKRQMSESMEQRLRAYDRAFYMTNVGDDK